MLGYVTGLQTELNNKANVNHNHDSVYLKISDYQQGQTVTWTDILNKPSQFSPVPHYHNITDVLGLQATLDSSD